jgi:aryl-alcohol dehydrogenase-like predicted oxidoreductase
MTESPFAIDVARVPRRRLGSTTVTLGAVGLGCMGLTGVYDIEHRDERRATAAVLRALDLGVEYLDTADSFGPFGNERFLGSVLAGRRAEAVLASKVGITGRSDGTYHHNATPEHIHDAIDESLRRLQTDYLDVYLLQAVDPEVPAEESWAAMAELVQEGKVRMLGIRTEDTEVLARLQRVFPVSVVTAELSYMEQGNLPLAAWAAARGIAFVASSPLGRGLLTGSIAANRTFPWTDLRSKLPKFTPEALRSGLALLEPLRDVAREHGVKPGQVALAWLLEQGDHVIPIPGSSNPEHVLANAAASHVTLTPQDRALLAGEGSEQETAGEQ